jgi:hypothetical protein
MPTRLQLVAQVAGFYAAQWQLDASGNWPNVALSDSLHSLMQWRYRDARSARLLGRRGSAEGTVGVLLQTCRQGVDGMRVPPFLEMASCSKGRHFDRSVILLCVRWYLAYGLSLRDLEEMMAERGVAVDHSTVNRWVRHFSPILLTRFNCRKHAVGGKWHMDETLSN